MRHNIVLLVSSGILSMVEPSHTATSFLQITSSELIRPYCNATNITDAFFHDVIPFQSCAPTDLTRDTINYKGTNISENATNMSCAGVTTTKYSMDIARVAISMLDGLHALTILLFLFAMWAFCYKFVSVVYQWAEWTHYMPRNIYNESSMLGALQKYRKRPELEYLLKESGVISYRHVSPDISLNIYFLKEAFEELERHQRILEDPNIYDFATSFLLDPVPRAALMKIPDDRKFDWLNKRYRDNIIIGWRWRKIFHENIV